MKLIGYDLFDRSQISKNLKQFWFVTICICFTVAIVSGIYTAICVKDDTESFLKIFTHTIVWAICLTRLVMFHMLKDDFRKLILDLDMISEHCEYLF